jgi:thioredoxin-like negative regulator of GroEL
MAPVVDRLKTEYEGKVEFRLLNADTDPEAASLGAQFDIQYVPTFVLLDSDGSVSEVIIGEVSEQDLRDALDALR